MRVQSQPSKSYLYLKAAFELLADKVEYDGVDAGVYSRQVYAEVIKNQQETSRHTQTLQLHLDFTMVAMGLVGYKGQIKNGSQWKFYVCRK